MWYKWKKHLKHPLLEKILLKLLCFTLWCSLALLPLLFFNITHIAGCYSLHTIFIISSLSIIRKRMHHKNVKEERTGVRNVL